MQKIILGTAALCLVSAAAWAATSPATVITNDQVQAVLKAGPKSVDHTIRVFDMGQGYDMSVAIIKRDAPKPNAAPNPAAAAAAAARAAKAVPCGLAAAPAGAKTGPKGMIAHDDTAETYIVTSGSGTLVTGGTIVGGRRSAPDDEVTTTLNGPSCSGPVVGNYQEKKMNVGDIAVIPAGIPHGWTDITDHVTYLSVRPDPKKVLKYGYVNPAIK